MMEEEEEEEGEEEEEIAVLLELVAAHMVIGVEIQMRQYREVEEMTANGICPLPWRDLLVAGRSRLHNFLQIRLTLPLMAQAGHWKKVMRIWMRLMNPCLTR